MKLYTIIRFTQVGRGAARGQTRHVWVKTVSWGEGNRVKSVQFTDDRDKAAHLSSTMALSVAEQFFTHRIALEHHDGTPNVGLTALLLKSQMEKREHHNEAVRKANEEMRAFWSDMVAAVPALAKLISIR